MKRTRYTHAGRAEFHQALSAYKAALASGKGVVGASLRVHAALSSVPKSFKTMVNRAFKAAKVNALTPVVQDCASDHQSEVARSHIKLSGLLEDENAENDDIRDAAIELCESLSGLQSKAKAALQAQPKVWVLIYDNDSGLDADIFETEAAAKAALYAYVETYWATEMTGPIPKDQGEAVELYFGRDDNDDRAEIVPCEIQS